MPDTLHLFKGGQEMIHGVGIDIIEVCRIDRATKQFGEKFLNRIFTTNEINYCLSRFNPSQHLAVRFAAKEAVIKALGTRDNISGSNIHPLKGIEVIRNEITGSPEIRLHSHIKILADRLNIERILISLSHTESYAIAYATCLLGKSYESL